MHEARAMTAYYRSDSSPCSLQTLLANGDFDSDMVYEDAYPSPSSPATLSAPPTPRTHQSPMTTTMFPACNDDPTMTSPPPPPPFPDQQDSPEAFCEFVFFNGFQQGIVVVMNKHKWIIVSHFTFRAFLRYWRVFSSTRNGLCYASNHHGAISSAISSIDGTFYSESIPYDEHDQCLHTRIKGSFAFGTWTPLSTLLNG